MPRPGRSRPACVYAAQGQREQGGSTAEWAHVESVFKQLSRRKNRGDSVALIPRDSAPHRARTRCPSDRRIVP